MTNLAEILEKVIENAIYKGTLRALKESGASLNSTEKQVARQNIDASKLGEPVEGNPKKSKRKSKKEVETTEDKEPIETTEQKQEVENTSQKETQENSEEMPIEDFKIEMQQICTLYSRAEDESEKDYHLRTRDVTLKTLKGFDEDAERLSQIKASKRLEFIDTLKSAVEKENADNGNPVEIVKKKVGKTETWVANPVEVSGSTEGLF